VLVAVPVRRSQFEFNGACEQSFSRKGGCRPPEDRAGLAPSLRRSSFAMLRAAVFRRARDFMVRTSAADYGRLF